VTDPLLAAVLEIKELVKLIAEPHLARRDQKLREALKDVVGRSSVRARVISLLDGTRTQAQISSEARVDKSDLSKLVKSLREANLLREGSNPCLAIEVPRDFFEAQDGAK
jgi:hypothetical protein